MIFDAEEKRKTLQENEENTSQILKDITNYICTYLHCNPLQIFNIVKMSKKEKETLLKTIYSKYDVSNLKQELAKKTIHFLKVAVNCQYPYHLKRIFLELAYPYELSELYYRTVICFIYNYGDTSIIGMESKLLKKILDYSFKNNIKEEEIEYLIRNSMNNYINKETGDVALPKININPRQSNQEIYDKIETIYENIITKKMNIIFFSREEYFAFSELITYIIEKKVMEENDINIPPRWVARYDGDGMHYDILSYDIEDKCEKTIEVKSTTSERDEFFLTKAEKEFIENAKNINKYVYFFRIINKESQQNIEKRCEFFILKYIPSKGEFGYFIDQNGAIYESYFNYKYQKYGIYKTNEKGQKNMKESLKKVLFKSH